MNGSNCGVEFKSIGEKPAPQPVNDYGEFCDANGDGDIDSGDAQLVLNYYVVILFINVYRDYFICIRD